MPFRTRISPDVLVLALLTLCCALYLAPTLLPLFRSELPPRLGSDIVSQYYPSKVFLARSLRAGDVPLWNPYTFSGVPFLANPQRAALFYPDTLLYRFFTVTAVLVLTQALHMLLAAWGMYLLVSFYTANRIAGTFSAVAFAFGGFFAQRILMGHLPQMQASAYLPLLMCLFERILRQKMVSHVSLAVGLCFALCFFAGYPETNFMIALVLFARLTWEVAARARKGRGGEVRVMLANCALAALVGLGTIAIQLLPTLELLSFSERANTTWEGLRARSLPPMNLITLLVPDFFGSIARRNAMQGALIGEMNAYVGVSTVCLAAFAAYLRPSRITVFFSFVALGSLFLALGSYNPLYRLVFALPGFHQVAAPLRFLFLFGFAAPVLAGLSLAALMEQRRDPRKLRRVILTTGTLALFAAIISGAYVLLKNRLLDTLTHMVRTRYPDDAARRLAKLPDFYAMQTLGLWALTLLLVLTVAALLWCQRNQAKRQGMYFAVVCLSLLAADLTFFNLKSIYAVPELLPPVAAGADFSALTPNKSEHVRVFPLPDSDVYPDQNLVGGFPSIVGYDPIMLHSYRKLLAALENVEPDALDSRAPLVHGYESPIAQQLSVGYVLSRHLLSGGNLLLERRDGPVYVYRKTAFDPRAYIVHQVEGVEDETALRRLQQGEGGFRANLAFVSPGESPLSLRGADSAERIESLETNGPNEIVIQAAPRSDGLLVVGDTWFPGWRATVDGKAAPVIRTNYVFRGVPISAGEHTVRLVYRPDSVKYGAAVTLFTLLVTAALWAYFTAGRVRYAREQEGR